MLDTTEETPPAGGWSRLIHVVRRKVAHPKVAARPAVNTEAAPTGFEFGKAPSARAAKVTKVGWRVVLGLTFVLVVVLVGQNVVAANRTTTAAAAPGINADDARSVAATFTSSYLSHNPAAAPTAGQAALQRDLDPGGDPAKMSFTGTGWMATDMVLPGAVTTIDLTHAVVAVQARVTLARPGNADAVPDQAVAIPNTPAGRPANITPLPRAYVITGTQWLSLTVPVLQTDAGVRVDPFGPAFLADPQPAPQPAAETDSTATEATRTWVKTLFTAYAAGSTQSAYLSAPAVNLTGLSGAVTVADVTAWSLSAPNTTGVRTGHAQVGWTFAPTADLTTTQNYTVTVTASDNRWYATGVGASSTPTSSN